MKNLFNLEKIRRYTSKPFWFFFFTGIFIHIDKIILGKYAVTKAHDFWDTMWPIQAAIVERVKQGKFPLWNAGYQSGVQFGYWDINWLSIPVLISMISTGPLGYFLVMFTQYLIATCGMYLFLQKFFFYRSQSEKVLGSVVWGFSIINLTYWRVPDLASLPLFIYSIYEFDNYLSGKKEAWSKAVFSFTIVALNVYLLKGLPALLLFITFFIFVNESGKYLIRKILTLGIMSVVIILVNAPTLITFLVYNNDRMRTLINQNSPEANMLELYLGRLWNLFEYPHITIAMPIGSLALFIFAVSLFNYKKWTSTTRSLFKYYFIAATLFIFTNATPWMVKLREFLPFPDYHLSHLLLVETFIVFVIIFENVPFFVEYIREYPKRVLGVVLVLLITLTIFHPRHGYPTSVYEMLNSFLAAGLLWIGYKTIQKNSLDKISLVILINILILTDRSFNIFIDKLALVNPPTFERFANSPSYQAMRESNHYSFRMTYINYHPSIGLFNNFQVAGGESNDYPIGYALYWNQVLKEDPSYFRYPYKTYLYDLKSLFEKPTPNILHDLNFNFELLAFNNVKYIATVYEIERPEQYGLKLFYQGDPPIKKLGIMRLWQAIERTTQAPSFFIYQLENFTPRFFLNSDAKVFSSTNEIVNVLKNKNRKDLPKQALLLKDDIPLTILEHMKLFSPPSSSNQSPDQPTVISYDDDRYEIIVNVKKPTLLMLNDNYTPNWFAKVNGASTPLIKANLVMKAVPLIEPGINRIEVYYAPKWIIWGYYLSCLSAIALATLTLSACYSLVAKKPIKLREALSC